jgi:hypothetical protein
VWTDLTSITLQPGEYDLTGVSGGNNNGAVAAGTTWFGISTTAGNSAAGLNVSENQVLQYNAGTSGINYPAIVPNYRVVITSPTTFYLKAMHDATTTNLRYSGYRLSARKVK